MTKFLKFSVDDWSLQFNSSKYPNVKLEAFKYYIFSAYNFYRSYFRVHKYWVLESENNSKGRMTSTVELNENATICMDIIALIKENGKFSVQAKSRGFEKNSQVSHMEKNVWKKERIKFEKIPKGKYDITVEGSNFVIGQIKFCDSSRSDGYLITTNTTLSRTCNSLNSSKKGQLHVEIHNKNYQANLPSFNVTDHAREIICKELGNPECENILACDVSGCFCFSGYSGSKCMQRCTNGNFGPNCKNSVDTRQNCTGNGTHGNYSVHTGKCFSCAEGFRAPDCNDGIIVYPTFPTVTSNGRIATVNLSLAWKDEKVNKYFHHGLVQFRVKESDQTWENYTFEKGSLFLNVTNLSFNTTYDVRIVLVEINGGSHEKGAKIGTFSTPKCLPISFAESAVFENGSWRLTGDENLCKIFDCKLQYSEKNVSCNETDKRKKFTIFLTAEDGSSFFKYFSSEYLNPEPQEQTSIIHMSIGITLAILVFVVLIFISRNVIRRFFTTVKQRNDTLLTSVPMDNIAPLPSTGEACVEISTLQHSKEAKIKVSEFEEFLERAIKSGLLKQQHRVFPRGQTKPWEVGTSVENKKKNRYGNLAAYDETRVRLKVRGAAVSDYINANYVDGFNKSKAYIATQGPKKTTLVDFWSMIWHESVDLIVMVANVIENGKVKCEKYWPDIEQTVCHGSFKIQNLSETIHLDFMERSLVISNGDESRQIIHMHYTMWPDHGVPFYPRSMADFAERIIDIATNNPITVHCSAGVGRTGTLMLIDACLRMARATEHLSPFEFLGKMRSQRANLVDNELQYTFVHSVLYEALCIPKFHIECNSFTARLQNLMASNKMLLKEEWNLVGKISAKDWEMLEKDASFQVPEDKCKDLTVQSVPNKYIKLLPEVMEGLMNTFIDAVCVDGFNRKDAHIITATPMSNTIGDFWRMIYQRKIEQIIVLNERAQNEPIFLPSEPNSPLCFTNLAVSVQKTYNLKNCRIYTLGVHKENDNQMVNVVLFPGWPAGTEAPQSIFSLIELWEETEISRSIAKPSVLVCNDGYTACGLFIALGFMLEKMKLEHQVDVPTAVRVARLVKPRFLTSMEQYEMLYSAAQTYLEAFDTYGNFK
ncbi:receptor-type tyrosine-protein phosphatase epsilon-like isoform X2 [Neocloeon triangulifer]|nr:receptor-type tyrosine-protein phosphatase epsilon-like isoform X2 [Neocloeon triangulifer]